MGEWRDSIGAGKGKWVLQVAGGLLGCEVDDLLVIDVCCSQTGFVYWSDRVGMVFDEMLTGFTSKKGSN